MMAPGKGRTPRKGVAGAIPALKYREELKMGKTISLAEYARRHERNLRACQIRAAGGGFKTAYKSGKMWLIDEDEPYIDRRVKSGKYRNWRRKEGQAHGGETL